MWMWYLLKIGIHTVFVCIVNYASSMGPSTDPCVMPGPIVPFVSSSNRYV